MNNRKLLLPLFYFCLLCIPLISQTGSLSGIIIMANDPQTAIPEVSVFLAHGQLAVESKNDGSYRIKDLAPGTYEVVFFKEEFLTLSQKVIITANENTRLDIELQTLNYQLEAVEIEAEQREKYGLNRLRNVEGLAIYAAKKNEVISLDKLVANLATNNPRQVYKGIAGLNIWESDGAGLQLGIGARGLDPNRTSNFNTRQNGYDISADALGYPESYYTPPTQALKRIEIVRGAASLQYGSQFGGLLNFVFKQGPRQKAFEFFSENTIGSFGLFSSFNSIGGARNGWNYYAFYQRKQGDGWRANSDFEQNTAFVNVTKTVNRKLKIGIEHTHMNYLAHQAGGLQDFEFEQDPRQSKRTRNWFKVNWNLSALSIDYKINDKTKINSRSFLLSAKREALGELGPINRPDPLRERDLIRGNYNNFGNETRLITRYAIKSQPTTLLLGLRYYQGLTKNQQGNANAEAGPSFRFLNPDDLERSEYEFPSQNIAFFVENLFNINHRLSITPGLRYEYIKTSSDGFYKETLISGGMTIFEQKIEDQRTNRRSILIAGLGLGYKVSKNLEAYTNFSQNYRSINFSDLAIVNPNLIVDSLLTDEKGFNADLGIRGTLLKGAINFDATIFLLKYNNRIGITEIVIPDPVVVEKAVAFRTNIGNARVLGIETYFEADLLKLRKIKSSDIKFSLFANISVLHGKYLSGSSAVVGNDVELIPPINIKTGLNFTYKDFRASYQFTFVREHFSDATNAAFVVDATRGNIPDYQVQDLSFSYNLKFFRIQAGINNLLNEYYFTRRAVAYPGPGIIPADGRNYYGAIAIKF